jgi:hypothetical protein
MTYVYRDWLILRVLEALTTIQQKYDITSCYLTVANVRDDQRLAPFISLVHRLLGVLTLENLHIDLPRPGPENLPEVMKQLAISCR